MAEQPGPVVVVPHSNPDGDAIGSAYGLAVVLRNGGREVKIVSPNDYPSFLGWLNGEVEIINYLKKRGAAEAVLRRSSVMFCVDFNEIKRADEMEKEVASFRGVKILIDHHPEPTPFCDLMGSEPTYSSSAELVFDLGVALGPVVTGAVLPLIGYRNTFLFLACICVLDLCYSRFYVWRKHDGAQRVRKML